MVACPHLSPPCVMPWGTPIPGTCRAAPGLLASSPPWPDPLLPTAPAPALPAPHGSWSSCWKEEHGPRIHVCQVCECSGTGGRTGCPSLVAPCPTPRGLQPGPGWWLSLGTPRGLQCPRWGWGSGHPRAQWLRPKHQPGGVTGALPVCPWPRPRNPPGPGPHSVHSRKHLFPVHGAAEGGGRKNPRVPAGYL